MKNRGPKISKLAKLPNQMPTNAFREEGMAQTNNRHARRRNAKLKKAQPS